MRGEGEEGTPAAVRLAGLAAGALLFVATLALPPPGALPLEAWRVSAILALMVCWWISEALPIAATALVPVVAFPLLGVADIAAATAPYANPLIFLFLGGFLIAAAIERCGLHRRLALAVIRVFGTRPAALVGGFMAATAALSMWLSNTATAVMMLPIALSVIRLAEAGSAGDDGEARRRFAIALLLGVAYGASIGGVGTLIGTPPNALLAAYMADTYGQPIGFAQWMLFGVPLSVVMLAAAWLLLTRLVFALPPVPLPGVAALIAQERARLGPWRQDERRVAAIFVIVAGAWVARPYLAAALPDAQLSDSVIAILGGLLLFIVPAGRLQGPSLLGWEQAKALPWGVLVLFGGGLSLAATIESSGLAAAIGGLLADAGGWPPILVVLAVTMVGIFVTEIASNTAIASIFVPIAATLGSGIGLGPLALAVPAAVAASYAFMMPVATPPNAVVFASGHMRIIDMARAGLALNLVAAAVTTGFTYWMVWVLARG